MSSHYVLDFDGTLFQTDVLWHWLMDRFTQEGLDSERVRSVGEKLFSLGYTAELHARELELQEETVRSIVREFDKVTMSTSPSLVYQDVIPFLETMPTEVKSILTFGEAEFQKGKIRAANLDRCVGEIRIAGPEYRKLKHINELLTAKNTTLIFVDDNPLELLSIYKAGLPVELVRMRRENARHTRDDHELDHRAWRVIRSFEELS